MSVTIKRWTEDGPDTQAGFVVGVDFGQARDFSAIAINEVACFERQSLQQDQFHAVPSITRRATLRRHNIRFIERMPLGTSYPDVVRRCCEVMDRLPVIPTATRKPLLVADATGCGRPVLDVMREAGLRPLGVTITGGSSEIERDWDDVSVPKKILASLLHVNLDDKRLRFAAALPELPLLLNELASFRVKITSARNESFESWREREHDDLVLATALAVWGAEKRQPMPARKIAVPWRAI